MTVKAVAFTLTGEQRAAIEAPLGPLLLVAGAGTGKTTVMAQRILWLVESGAAQPDQILGLTFTNKAAFNLKAKVRAALGPDGDVTIGTYHSFGAGLVRAHSFDLGLARGTQLLDRAQAWQLLFTVFDEFRFERRSALMPEVILEAALTLASRAADYLVPIGAVAADSERLVHEAPWKNVSATAAGRLELCQVVAAYERRKRERDLLDFGDQVGLAVRLLEGRPDLAEAQRRHHPVVLLDEYQDTNYAQRRLLQLIYPAGSAVTAVGDDMQSIYAFRGAHLFNILHFGQHFGGEGGEGGEGGATRRQALQVTFRFGEPLATVANRIQSQVGDALPKELRPAPGAAPTAVECFLAADDGEEAATIAADVVDHHDAGAAWGDHAVLCRKRRLIKAIVAAFAERNVPVEVIGASGLLDRPEVVDLVAWIEVLADPGALVALLRILQGPRYRIGLRDLAALARHGRAIEGSLAAAIEHLEDVPDLSDAARSRLADYRRERTDLAQVATRVPLLDLAETVVLHTGLWRAAGGVGRENLLRFLDLASRFAPVEGEPTLTAFVEYLQLLDQSEEDVAEAHPSDIDAVRIMTIHQAKGLEFPVVYVPGLAGSGSSRIFPDDRAHENAMTNASALPWWLRADDEGLPDLASAPQNKIVDALRRRRKDEEWRLFYVACTRAQRRLVCSAAHWYAGPAEPQGPSEFYELVSALAAEGLVTERFRHDPATADPDVAAKQRRRDAAGARYAAPVASDPAQLQLGELAVSPAATAPPRLVPDALSVTSLVSYARCPKQFFWSVVRPLPRRSSAAARLGTAVHRWIEQRSGRQLSLMELGIDDPDELPRDAAVAAALKDSFLLSPWADLDPERVEAPFALAAGRHVVRGRVDAVYQRDGRLELVDFKTGRPTPPGDRPATLQLNLYGLAAVDTWGADPDRLRTTYCYLRTDGPPALFSADWDADALEEVRAELVATLDRLATDRFDATPGPYCRSCDFLPACAPGRRSVDG